jgi:SAM-dependent methyltransferase
MKQRIVRALRTVGLLAAAERAHLVFVNRKQRRKNVIFSQANPGFMVPPEALAYDAYGWLDWDLYKKSGADVAVSLSEVARRHLPEHGSLRVLEWGCGPARVIRHIPAAFGAKTNVYGSDYNNDTIKWCSKNIIGVNFTLNGLEPPLAFDSGFFDFVYSISVFTHLSESVSRAWLEELLRVTHSGSILVITMQGDAYLEKLLPDEVEAYRSRGIVLRGNVTEGSRIFSAFHSKDYLTTQLFQNLEVLEFIPSPKLGQDMWILRKP